MNKVVSVMPIKLNNERLPGKNTRILGGKPLLQYELDTLLQVKILESINVYCSDRCICEYLPRGVKFIQRPQFLDLPEANFTQIFRHFLSAIRADIYVYAHATAPFISVETIEECIGAVLSGKYDSAFSAVKMQDFFWSQGKPLNFDASNIPRSQDLKPIYRETSGVYVFRKEVFLTMGRRIGEKPFIKIVPLKEAIDINNIEDFEMAEFWLNR